MNLKRDDIHSSVNYHDMMGSVGNLRDEDQGRYINTISGNPQFGYENNSLGSGNSYVGWWKYDKEEPKNNKISQKAQLTQPNPQQPVQQQRSQKTLQRQSLPQTSDKSSNKAHSINVNEEGEIMELSDDDDIEITLINLDTPSPYIWTIGSFIVTTIVMIAEIYQISAKFDMKVNPMVGPNSEVLLLLGAKYAPFIYEGEIWRLITAIFLQSGVIGWIASGVIIFFMKSIERETGFYRMFFIYMVCGSYGYILSSIFIPNVVTCGTTGALIGLVGVMLADLTASWRMLSKPWIRLVGLLFIITILLLAGLTPYIDNFAHIGGFIMGVMAALMLIPNLNFGRFEAYCHGLVAFLAFPAMTTLFMVSLVIILRSTNDTTSWCKGCLKFNCLNFGNNWCTTLQYN